jgi:class 3 adenylate cyclase/CheY-like chemotaxis protein
MKYKVLAVDDNKMILSIIRIAFKEESQIEIFTALNGVEAIEMAKELMPDIILMDFEMPVMNGIEALISLKSNFHTKDIPVIMITATRTLADAFSAGAIDFIHKPIDKLELLARVKSTLSLFKLLNDVTAQAEQLELQAAKIEAQKFTLEAQKEELEEQRDMLESQQILLLEQTKTLENQKKGLEQQQRRLHFKTLELEIQNQKLGDANRRSDELLLNILPYEVAEQLKNKGYVEPKHYKRVSVLFTDFKGFTKIAEQLTSREIIKELDICFEKFDEIIEQHYIEKIKTIGDSYMCVGGLPLRNKSNPIDVTLAGLKMQEFMVSYNQLKRSLGQPEWDLRLGIHTGEVMAGVIGKKKFAYDIWGDTVNTASRMESSGMQGQVNVSGNTYKYIKRFFDCTYRGKIEAKNKGIIDMYFVNGLKPEFSLNGSPTTPNQDFLEVLSTI